jgi:hypothetical protein
MRGDSQDRAKARHFSRRASTVCVGVEVVDSIDLSEGTGNR